MGIDEFYKETAKKFKISKKHVRLICNLPVRFIQEKIKPIDLEKLSEELENNQKVKSRFILPNLGKIVFHYKKYKQRKNYSSNNLININNTEYIKNRNKNAKKHETNTDNKEDR